MGKEGSYDKYRLAQEAAAVPDMSPGKELAVDKATNVSLVCVDRWDWRTDAPEFVPDSMKAVIGAAEDWKTDVPEFVPAGMKTLPAAPEVPGPATCSSTGVGTVATGPTAPSQSAACWTTSSPAPASRGAANNSSGSADGSRLSQLQAQYEWQLRTKTEEFRDLQSRMNQLEIDTAQVRASWDVDRRSLVRQVSQYRSVLERYSIPLEEASSSALDSVDEGVWNDSASSSQWPSAAGQSGGIAGSSAAAPSQFSGGVGHTEGGAGPSSSLDSKMRQLNNLLQGGSSSRRRSMHDTSPAEAEATEDPTAKGPAARGDSKEDAEGKGIGTTSWQKSPHAAIRNGSTSTSEDRDDFAGIEHTLQLLERQTNSQVDERAMRALTSLIAKDAREALGKVDELVTAQGGTCRNLSSILQSICRKIEKRTGKVARAEDVNGTSSADQGGSWRAASRASGDPKAVAAEAARQSRTRRADEDRDAFAAASSSDGDRPGKDVDKTVSRKKLGPKALEDASLVRAASKTSLSSYAPLDTPAGKRSNRSWADIHSGDEDEGGEGGEEGAYTGDAPGHPREEDSEDPWTQHRQENVAKGGLELRRGGDCSELKTTVASLEQAFTEVGICSG